MSIFKTIIKKGLEKMESRRFWESTRYPAIFLFACAALCMAVYALLLPAITIDRDFALATDSDLALPSWQDGADAGEKSRVDSREGELAAGSYLATGSDLETAFALASGSDLERAGGELATGSDLPVERPDAAEESRLVREMQAAIAGDKPARVSLDAAAGDEIVPEAQDTAMDVQTNVLNAETDLRLHAGLRSGASLNGNGDYVWTAANTSSGHAFVFRVSFAMSGLWEQEAGAVEIRLPAGILLDRDGQAADAFELSIPSDTDEGLGEGNALVYRVEGEELVIYNRLPLSSAEQFYIEASYSTTEPSYAYADYDPDGQGAENGNPDPKNGSKAFKAVLFLNGEECARSVEIPVYMDSCARIASSTLSLPTYYTGWQSSWGERPSDAEDWYYLLWEVRSILRDVTQPYDFSLSSDFAPSGAEGASLGNVVAYKMQGDAAFVPAGAPEAGIVRDLRSSYAYGRYDYVLTRHLKSAYENLETYTLSNAVTAHAIPADKVDRAGSASGSRAWTYETKFFTPPGGKFYMYKWGLDYSGSRVTDSEHIRRFTLSEFMDGGNTAAKTIEDLAYYSYVEGYPGKQTVGAAGNAGNPEDYWREAVTYELSDSAFYLKSVGTGNGYIGPLSMEDYQIDSLELNCYARDARFDEISKQFVSSGSADYADGGLVQVFLQINREVDAEGGAAWQLAGAYSMEDGSFLPASPADGAGNAADAGEAETGSGVQEAITRYAGKTLYFSNTESCTVTGFRLLAESAHYYTILGAWPHVSLKHSETVDRVCGEALDLEAGGQSKIALKNTASAALYQADGSRLMQFGKSGEAYTIGLKRHGSLRLAVAASQNDKLKKQYRITWEAESGESYLVEGNRRVAVRQEGGIFYALLPKGGAYRKDSLLCYADGQRLSEGDYSLEILRDYQGYGQDLLLVKFYVPADAYRFRYTTVHPWDTIQDYGEAVYSNVAYETGNGDIGDGRAKDACSAAGGILLTARSGAAEGAKKFLCTQAGHTIHALTAASLGLYKKVMAGEDSDYSYESTVSLDEGYTYRIRFAATDEETSASDLIVFDALESYAPASDADGGDWRGSLQGIVLGKQHEYGMRPVFYYREDVPDFQEIGEALGEASGGGEAYSLAAHGWTDQGSYLATHEDLSGVRAFAIDLRASEEEGKAFSLGPDQAVSITVYMRSPAADNTRAADPVAYNNVYLYSTITHADLAVSESEMIRQDYTTLHLRATGDMEILKVDSGDPGKGIEGVKFQLRGRSDYGTEVEQLLSSNRLGKIAFSKIEKGNYSLQEVDGVPDYQQDHSLMSVSVSGDGRVVLGGAQGEGAESGYQNVLSSGMDEGSGIYKMTIANEPRVHGELRFQKKGRIDGSDALKALPGATFRIQGISDYGNDILLYAVSGADGEMLFPNIEMGKYELEEFQAAEGYICQEQLYTVQCGADGNVRLYERAADGSETEMAQDQDGGECVFLNEPYHGFRLLKQDAVNHEVLEGAEFLLSGISDYGTPVEQRQCSDQNGVAAFAGLEPGKYVLKELQAPAKHLRDTAERLVQIDARGNVRIEGLEAMAEDGFKGYFVYGNARELGGTVTITKSWAGEDGERALPVLYLDSKEPEFGLPVASIDRTMWNRYAKVSGRLDGNTLSFSRAQEKDLAWLKRYAFRIDDRKTKYSVYFWAEGTAAYWWSDASVIYLPADCSSLFQDCKSLESLDLRDFDTSKTTNMGYMFDYCLQLSELNLDGFETGKVTNMHSMFSFCKSLKSIDVSSFDTRSVTDMGSMFYFCINLTSLDLSAFHTENVKYFSYMFYACTRLTSLNVSSFDTGAAEGMQYMFYSVESIRSLDVGHFRTGNVGVMTAMFSRCFALESLDLHGWDTGKATDMMMMFSECKALESLDVSSFDTSKLNSFYMIFYNCNHLETLDLSSWDSGNVVDMTYSFSGCGSLRTIYVGDAWTTENVKYSRDLFTNCTSIVGGQGTVFDKNYIDASFARVDGGPDSESPGYLSSRAVLGDDPVLSSATEENPSGGVEASPSGSSVEANDAGSMAASLLSGGGVLPVISRLPYMASLEEGHLLSDGRQQNSSSVSSQQVSRDTVWHGTEGEDAANVYGQWIDNGDGSLTYRFKVYDMDADYYLWEGVLPGYTAEYALEGGEFAAGESLQIHYQAGKEVKAYVRNTWTGEEESTGSLLIRKEVEGAELDEAERARKFTFHIQLSSPLTNYYGDVLFKKGSATVQLAHQQSIRAVGLPAGVSYEVTEEPQEGYTLMSQGESGTIQSGETCVSEFLNRKAEESIDRPAGTLRIAKSLVAKDASVVLTEEDRQQKFRFSLRLSGEGAEEVEGIYGGIVFSGGACQFALSDQEAREIPGLPAGLHYTVREEAGAYEASWTAGQRGGSGVEASGTVPEGGTEEIAFSNQKNENEETGGFVLQKTVLGRDSGQKFPFYISFSGLRRDTLYAYGEGNSFLSDSRGEAGLSLRLGNGDSLAFPDLPEGAGYSITEEASNYVPSFTAHEAGEGGRILSSEGAQDAAASPLSTARESVEAGEEAVFSFQNQSPVFEVFFQKLDEEGGGLAGAVLQVYELESDAPLLSWESSGEPSVQELAEGSYRLHEEEAPEGYLCAEDINFSVDAGGKLFIEGMEAQSIAMQDLPTRLAVLKVDDGDLAPLPGAMLQILDGDAVVETWLSTQEEKFLSGKLSAGREYRLREKKAPDGYELSEDICFTIQPDGTLVLTEAPTGALEQAENAEGAYARILMRDRRGRMLPGTGSIGTGPFRCLGLCLLLLSLILGICSALPGHRQYLSEM